MGKAQEQESGEAGIAEYFQQVGKKIGHNVFAKLYRVNLADLHKLDLLQHIYLGLFKHIMESVEVFLQKNKTAAGVRQYLEKTSALSRIQCTKKGLS